MSVVYNRVISGGSDGGGGSGASTALDNLTATAINQHLEPDANMTRSIGNNKIWSYLGVNSIGVTATDFANYWDLYINDSPAIVGALTDVAGVLTQEYHTGQPKDVAHTTGDNGTNDAVSTGGLIIKSGDKTAGTGDSGPLVLQTGTSAGGARGPIRLIDGSEGTSGHVWTSTDTNGNGAWAANSGGGVGPITNATWLQWEGNTAVPLHVMRLDSYGSLTLAGGFTDQTDSNSATVYLQVDPHAAAFQFYQSGTFEVDADVVYIQGFGINPPLLKLAAGNAVHSVALSAPSTLAANYTLTLPAAAPASGSFTSQDGKTITVVNGFITSIV